jgi:hypothetical protein
MTTRSCANLLIGRLRRETDEEFRARLLGSDAPQMQRIVTGVDPRLADKDDEELGGGTWGTRLDKLADEELSPEDREAKRGTHLWKLGNRAKEFAYKWKVNAAPAASFWSCLRSLMCVLPVCRQQMTRPSSACERRCRSWGSMLRLHSDLGRQHEDTLPPAVCEAVDAAAEVLHVYFIQSERNPNRIMAGTQMCCHGRAHTRRPPSAPSTARCWAVPTTVARRAQIVAPHLGCHPNLHRAACAILASAAAQ